MEDWLKCQISPLVKYLSKKVFMVKTRIIHDRCQNFYSTCIQHYSFRQKVPGGISLTVRQRGDIHFRSTGHPISHPCIGQHLDLILYKLSQIWQDDTGGCIPRGCEWFLGNTSNCRPILNLWNIRKYGLMDWILKVHVTKR